MKYHIISIREFTFKLLRTFLSLIKILILSKFVSLKKIDKKQNSVVILGNGPSLNEFLEKHKNLLEGKDSICVNFFARTKEYEQIKPLIYCITSPEYFTGDLKTEYSSSRMRTLNAIAERTTWHMYLVVPALAKNTLSWKEKIRENDNVKIVYFNNTPIEGFKWFQHLAFKWNAGLPRPHNVLIGCIWLSINIKYKEVFLVGADHSWLPEIRVDKNNNVLVLQSHFYDKQVEDQKNEINKPTLKPMFVDGTRKKRKLHEVLEKFYYSFKSYWILKDFADSRKIKIYNGTNNSFIDAFEKVNLDDL